MKRMKLWGMLLALVMCSGIAMAQVDMTFTGVGNWTDPNLWDVGSVPGSVELANYVNIMDPNTVCTVNTDTGAFAAGNQRLVVDNGATLVLEEGGVLAANTWSRIGVSGAGTVIQNGGLFEVQNDKLGIGDKDSGTGYYIMSGGTLTHAGDRGDLGVGSRTGTGTFTVIGTAPVIQMEELIVCERDNANGTVEFVLDANGVSPIVLSNTATIDAPGDTTNAALVVRANAVPPMADILLVDITSDANVAGVFDTVNGKPAPEGAEVVISCEGVSNTYLLTYVGGTGNDIVLQYVPPIAGLVVENPDQLMGFEPQMKARLESLGYVVVIIKGDDVKDDVFTVADAEALDVIVISEAISSSDVNRLAGADVPMMNGEGYGWQRLNYAEDGTQGWQDANILADVVNDTHPIVANAGLSVGTMEFLLDEKAETTTAQVSVLAPGAVSLVSMTISDAEYALVFAIDAGAELAKGAGPATNRIVGFSLPGGSQEANSGKNSTFVLSESGWALFDAAIRWLDPAPVEPVDPGTDGLLVYYPLDNDANDSSGNGNDGVIGGDPQFVDGALKFDGNDSITLPAEAMGMRSDVGSVSLWINTGVPSSINTIFWAGDNTTGGGFGPENEMHIHLEGPGGTIWMGGELSFFILANPNSFLHSDPEKGIPAGNDYVNPLLLGDNQWHNIVAVWDGINGIASMYVDGVLINSGPYTSTDYELTHMYLGQMANGGRTYSGLLDDVYIYNRALSEAEVLYLAGM